MIARKDYKSLWFRLLTLLETKERKEKKKKSSNKKKTIESKQIPLFLFVLKDI